MEAELFVTFRVLNFTVLDRGLKFQIRIHFSKQYFIPALSNSDHIPNLGVPEAGGQMDRHVLVPLLEPIVLSDIVKIITSDHDSSVHLHLGDDSGQHTATDGDLQYKFRNDQNQHL